MGPQGKLLWDWRSQDHTPAPRPGGWWKYTINRPARNGYDIPHWNSIEPHGNAVIASFRQLDAVYKINKGTGKHRLEARRHHDAPEPEGHRATRIRTPSAGNTTRACSPTGR